MALAPVDYGPQLQADTEGLQTARQQSAALSQDIRQLGSVIEGGAQTVLQGVLHTQALKATAAVKERQAATLEFIDSNPTVAKSALQQRMSPEDYTAWHADLAAKHPEYADGDSVPMFTAAGSLFDSEAKQARATAGQMIGTHAWREKWTATEQAESSTIRERYVNRLAADQMIADHRGQSLMAIDKMVDSAVTPQDLQTAATAAETDPWLKPAERRFTVEKILVAKDAFVARHAMLAGDTEVMAAELKKLQSDKAAELFPNSTEKQRLDLANQLTRENGFKMSKDIAEREIVGPNVDEHGKVNRTGIAETLAKYNGPLKEDVTKAVKVEEAQKLDIFHKKNAEIGQSILQAGQDPMTGRFSYAKAMQNPEARKAAYQLNKDDPDVIVNLGREDQRWTNIDAKADAAERADAKRALIKVSDENLKALHTQLDNPELNDAFKSMTPAQFDLQLYNRDMVEQDRQKARASFAAFQKNGGKADERPQASVKAEIGAAVNNDPTKIKQLTAKYGRVLLESAHQFIRDNPTLPPDKMTDALRAHIKAELLPGAVVNPGWHFNDGGRRIEWESSAKYAGKEFRLSDGTVLSPKDQNIHLTDPKTGRSGTFNGEDAAIAITKGWK